MAYAISMHMKSYYVNVENHEKHLSNFANHINFLF